MGLAHANINAETLAAAIKERCDKAPGWRLGEIKIKTELEEIDERRGGQSGLTLNV